MAKVTINTCVPVYNKDHEEIGVIKEINLQADGLPIATVILNRRSIVEEVKNDLRGRLRLL